MTKPISSDNFSTPLAKKQRDFDATRSAQGPGGGSDPSAAAPRDRPELDRAHQRLAHETGVARPVAIDSAQQARTQLERLKNQLHSDPRSALQAHEGIDHGVFEAAMARPSV